MPNQYQSKLTLEKAMNILLCEEYVASSCNDMLPRIPSWFVERYQANPELKFSLDLEQYAILMDKVDTRAHLAFESSDDSFWLDKLV